jgi:hypothetical protein
MIAGMMLSASPDYDRPLLSLTITDPVGNASHYIIDESEFSTEAGMLSLDWVDHDVVSDDGGLHLALIESLHIVIAQDSEESSIEFRIKIRADDYWDSTDPCWDGDQFGVVAEFDWLYLGPGEYETRLLHSVCAWSFDLDPILCVMGDQRLPDGSAIGLDVICGDGNGGWLDYASGLLLFAYGSGGGHGLPGGCASTMVPFEGWMIADHPLDRFRERVHYSFSEGDDITVSNLLRIQMVGE